MEKNVENLKKGFGPSELRSGERDCVRGPRVAVGGSCIRQS